MPDMLSISAPFITSSLPFVGSPVMIWMIDYEGIFQFVEGADSLKFFKLPGAVIGRSIFKVYADYPDILDNVRIALSGKSSKAFINQGECYWEYQVYPINGVQDNHNSVSGVFLIFRSSGSIGCSLKEYNQSEKSLLKLWNHVP